MEARAHACVVGVNKEERVKAKVIQRAGQMNNHKAPVDWMYAHNTPDAAKG